MMESSYKKKNLKFSAHRRELKVAELKESRMFSRDMKFSALRPIVEEDHTILDENKSSGTSRIPARVEMLVKWKQEKIIKKKTELQTKKPVFKIPISLTIPAVLPDVTKSVTLGKSFKELELTSGFDFSRAAKQVLSSGTMFNFQESSDILTSQPSSFVKSVCFAEPEVGQKSVPKGPNLDILVSHSSSVKTGISTKSDTSRKSFQKTTSKTTSAGKGLNISSKAATQIKKISKTTSAAESSEKSIKSTLKSTAQPQKGTLTSLNKVIAFGRSVTFPTSKPGQKSKAELPQKVIEKPKPTISESKKTLQKTGRNTVSVKSAASKPTVESTLRGILKPSCFRSSPTKGRNKTKTAPKPIAFKMTGMKKPTRKSESTIQCRQTMNQSEEDSSPRVSSKTIFKCDVSKIENIDANVKIFAPKSLASISAAAINYRSFNMESPQLRSRKKGKDTARTSTPLKNEDVSKTKESNESSNVSMGLIEKQDAFPEVEENFKLMSIYSDEKGGNINISETKQQEIIRDNPNECEQVIKPELKKYLDMEIEKFRRNLLKDIFKPRGSREKPLKRSLSCENILDVSKPSIMDVADLDDSIKEYKVSTKGGRHYDFDELLYEDEMQDSAKRPEVPKRVSLLFTPPRERKSKGQLVEEDLISFSP